MNLFTILYANHFHHSVFSSTCLFLLTATIIIAIRGNNTPVLLNETGDSFELCVVKRGGSISATGLTVELQFIDTGPLPAAGV